LTGALFAGWSIQFGVVPALLMGFGIAVLWGLINGFLVTRGKSLDVIVTLAMMMIAQGLTLLYTNGRPVIGFPEEMRFLGNADVAGIPMLVIVAVLMMLIIHIVLHYTVFGRELYAIGGNLEAARLRDFGSPVCPGRLGHDRAGRLGPTDSRGRRRVHRRGRRIDRRR
jgi:ribose transport system permease protein